MVSNNGINRWLGFQRVAMGETLHSTGRGTASRWFRVRWPLPPRSAVAWNDKIEAGGSRLQAGEPWYIVGLRCWGCRGRPLPWLQPETGSRGVLEKGRSGKACWYERRWFKSWGHSGEWMCSTPFCWHFATLLKRNIVLVYYVELKKKKRQHNIADELQKKSYKLNHSLS